MLKQHSLILKILHLCAENRNKIINFAPDFGKSDAFEDVTRCD
jgi:hypothetical protein